MVLLAHALASLAQAPSTPILRPESPGTTDAATRAAAASLAQPSTGEATRPAAAPRRVVFRQAAKAVQAAIHAQRLGWERTQREVRAALANVDRAQLRELSYSYRSGHVPPDVEALFAAVISWIRPSS